MSIVRIFVSSPGDCEPERKVLEEVIARINASDGERTGRQLRLFKWENDVIPRIGLAPQDVVDDQTPLCDIYLGIMSSKFGGDGTRESGTEIEFRQALKNISDKTQAWMLIYFNDDPPRAKSAADAKQFARVMEFREEVEKLGIVGKYSGVRGNENGFFERVEQDLRRLLHRPELSAARTHAAPNATQHEQHRSAPGHAGSNRQSRLDLVKAEKRLRCGVTKHPPLADYQYTDDRRITFSGYYVELARDVAARNGLQAEFVPIQWHEFMDNVFSTPAANPHALDLVLSVFETHDRRDYADFTCNFHCVDLRAVVQADSAIQSLDDLRDMRLQWAVAEGEAGWEYAVRELRIDPYDTIVVKHPDIGTALSVLSSGGDVAVVDGLTAVKFLEAHPNVRIRILDEKVWQYKNGIMIPRQDRLFEAWVRDEFCASRKAQPMLAAERQMLAECRGTVRKFA